MWCVDIGVNLTHASFRQDLTDVIYAAKDAGVRQMIVTGADLFSSQDAAALSANYPGTLFSTAGVHPHDAKLFDEQTVDGLRELVGESQVVAIGECGLDYKRDFSPRDQQRSCFEAQLQLAAVTGLPVFLHERDAFDPFLAILKQYRDQLAECVVHCFTGTERQLRAYLDLDLHVGVTGWICDERRGDLLRELVRLIPANRLMAETDAPYLPPRDIRPKVRRNEPRYLPHIVRTIAACRGEPASFLAPQILQTTRSFFRLP